MTFIINYLFMQVIGRECVYYFHDMIMEMINWGFQEGKTLFGFGYDFRQSNRYVCWVCEFVLLETSLKGYWARLQTLIPIHNPKENRNEACKLVVSAFILMHNLLVEKICMIKKGYVFTWNPSGSLLRCLGRLLFLDLKFLYGKNQVVRKCMNYFHLSSFIIQIKIVPPFILITW